MTTVKNSRDKKKTNIDPIILFAVFIVAALVFGILFYCTLPYISENYHQRLINKYMVSDAYEIAVQKASSSIFNMRIKAVLYGVIAFISAISSVFSIRSIRKNHTASASYI
jgi:uncharacterized membrane protein